MFEGSFKAIHVDDHNYLMHLIRYIHRNPINAQMVKELREWPYSNYLEWISERNGMLVDREFIKAYFATPSAYENFINDVDNKNIKKYLFTD